MKKKSIRENKFQMSCCGNFRYITNFCAAIVFLLMNCSVIVYGQENNNDKKYAPEKAGLDHLVEFRNHHGHRQALFPQN